MRRPKQKGHFLMVRVGADELLRWQKAARRDGLTLSEWVRRALNAECDPPQKAIDNGVAA